jgi:hypothetical protein
VELDAWGNLPMPRADDVHTLVHALDDPTPYVASPVRDVLKALPGGPFVQDAKPEAADQQADCASDEDRGRSHSGTAKRRNATAPPVAAICSLERQLTAPSAEQRVEALTALGKMREAAVVAENAVIRALSDPDIAVRLAAAHALDDIGAASQRAAWSLHAALGDSCLQVAASAQLSLLKLIVRLPREGSHRPGVNGSYHSPTFGR